MYFYFISQGPKTYSEYKSFIFKREIIYPEENLQKTSKGTLLLFSSSSIISYKYS